MKRFRSAKFRGNWRACWVILIALTLASARSETPSGASASAPPATHKIQVSDPLLARQIEAQGGQLIADYGSYQLYEAAQLAPHLLANSRVEIRDRYNIIRLNAGQLDTRKTEVKALRKQVGNFSGKRLHLVQFAGPVQPAWRDELLAGGLKIVSYIPENTYLVYGDAANVSRLQSLAANSPHIQWEGAFLDDYKIHPHARTVDKSGQPRDIGTDLFDIQLVADAEANAWTLKLLNQLKLEPFKRQVEVLNYLNLVVRLDPQRLPLVAAQPDVVSILPYFPPRPACERQDQIVAGDLSGNVPSGPGYLSWLGSAGFTQAQFNASGIAVDISDTGLDNGTTSPNHFGLYVSGTNSNASRVIYNRLEGTPNPGSVTQGCDGHGTINAHIVGGYDVFAGFPFADTDGYHYGLGVCPFVKLGCSVIFDPYWTYPNYNYLEADAYQAGARVSNNSWSVNNSEGAYNTDAQHFDALVRDAEPTNSTWPTDGNQQMVIIFVAGNDGININDPSVGTINAPGTAKNIISVGAADSVQAFGGSDRGSISDSEAASANEIASFSSRGPCFDGRVKPDIMAPGTHVSGGVYQATNDFVDFPDGLAADCFNGAGVDGGPDGSIFWPTNQQFYTASSGTSQAAPCVAGGCALVLQYFLNNFTNLASPAMAKAYLMNSARYMTGASAGDTLPSCNQGFGEMNLGMAFDGVPRILRDQVPADLLTNSGQFRAVTGVIANTNKPFRVTLAWTDAPGSTSGAAYNNNLDLTVTVGGNTYKGNVFSGGYSVAGGAADMENNVESVFLPAGISGNFVINVNGTSINSVGVPNASNVLCQDFALVVYNATAVARSVIASADAALSAESCLPTNGVIDPGEIVTVDFALQNIGTAPTTNLVATLETNSGVKMVSAPQSYGLLPAASAPVSRSFTFKSAGPCGGSITATLQLQDGPNNMGTMNFTFPLGQLINTTTFMESFDGVASPALPTNWTSMADAGEIPWTTTDNYSDTGINSVFAVQTNLAGRADLVSPVIPILTSNAQLSFMNYYDLASNPSDSPSPVAAYAGGALEIQIDNGGFMDILQAGGSFVSGSYTSAIGPMDDNPLQGRQVWSGDSGGFIPTVVNLPPGASGHNIQLEWSLGTEAAATNSGSGWYIDSIAIQDAYYACCDPLIPVTIVDELITGTNLTFQFQTVSNQTYTVQTKTNLSDPSWITLQLLTGDGSLATITNSATATRRYYRVKSP